MDWDMAQAIGTWAGALGAIVALVFFALQTRSLSQQTKSLVEQTQSMINSGDFDSQWRRHNKSSELALFYAQSILPRISYCSMIIEKTDIYPRLKSIHPKNMVRFNRAELEEEFGIEGNVRQMVKESVAKLDSSVFVSARYLVPPVFRYEVMEQLVVQGKLKSAEEESLHVLAESEFWHITGLLLNDLEYFSMCINSRIADGDILYPSLHQTFFHMISAFYFQIAAPNTNMKDKYFTHIITLFNDWKRQLFNHELKERQAEAEMSQQYRQVP